MPASTARSTSGAAPILPILPPFSVTVSGVTAMAACRAPSRLTSTTSGTPGLARTICTTWSQVSIRWLLMADDLVAGLQARALRRAAAHHLADHRLERRLIAREAERAQEIAVEIGRRQPRQVELRAWRLRRRRRAPRSQPRISRRRAAAGPSAHPARSTTGSLADPAEQVARRKAGLVRRACRPGGSPITGLMPGTPCRNSTQ